MVKKMKLPDPKRITRAIPMVMDERSNPQLAELGKMALAVLGYERLFEETATQTTLDRILQELEIEILNESEVQAYKKDRIKALNSGKEKIEETDDDDEEDDEEEVRRYVWSATSFQNYNKPIPEFVLAKAIQLKQALPQVSLTIHHVTRDLDPFLVASFGGVTHYIEVWNEPKFEGRLTKKDAERANLRTDVK